MKYTNKNQTNTNSSNTANTSGTARKNHKRKAIAAIMTIALAMSASAYPLNSVHAVDPVNAYIAAKIIPSFSLPSLNPIKAAGKLLGLVSDSDDAVKKGKKVDNNYKFKATKVANGSKTFKILSTITRIIKM